MSPLEIICIVMAVTLILGMPIFMCLGIAAAVALLVADVPLNMIPQVLFRGVDQFPLLAIPCFILAGSLMEYGGVTKQIVDVVLKPAARIHGGLGVATILACMFFSAISGSGPGTTAAVGALMIPTMIRNSYSREYAGAVASSGGTLGILIPPSNPMIIYGVIANVSITGMFTAGFIPGLMIGSAHCFVAWYVGKRLGYRGSGEKFLWGDFFQTCWRSKFSLAAPFVILGSIYGGVCTPVEASVVAVVYGFLVGAVINRQLNFKKILQSLIDAGMVGGTVIIIVGTSMLFAQLIAMEYGPQKLANLVLFIVGMQFTQLSTICCVWPPIIILRGTGRQSMACSIIR